ncbi:MULTISPECIES: hypothetical protein [Thermomonospora]|uniref:Uncharacterized protein n=1 Tax=Thermomonospora curvata (strain ATCC 19995 / DSM 43183 / JCM 3096 / KCTC 9072 / NBRC 15933 / NCIMB 10081 / Henssen B9) TaxID=471852 RepID=D1AE78_THECD|nr:MULTISPECIES: hypothetical protein [Thermomonospora]ACY99504.1 conserved hypothetical protein [Thermomonospora curvata DSM 43183]
MTLSPLDDYPIHQVPEVMRHTGTSDRNFYDRYYFNCFPLSGELMLLVGMGQYPNLGVTDAFALLRRGPLHRVVRASRELGADRMDTRVGPFHVEVLEGLRRLRVSLQAPEHGLSFDLTWEASIPAHLEPPHFVRWQERVIFDSRRLAQTGRWSGAITVDGETLTVTPDRWWGCRDRSWGIRPVGEPEPPGIQVKNPGTFYWLYAPMQFADHSILCIVQEDDKGRRILEEAVRIWPDPERDPEYLGRPEYRPVYREGTREVESATLSFAPPGGKPFDVRATPVLPVHLMVGTGYGLEPDWRHGMYQGPELKVQSVSYDLRKEEDAARMWGMVDALGRFEYDGNVGYGLLEYWALGPHPSFPE